MLILSVEKLLLLLLLGVTVLCAGDVTENMIAAEKKLDADCALHALKVAMKLRKENDPVLAKRYYRAGKSAESVLADTYEAIASIYMNLEDLEKAKAHAQKMPLRLNVPKRI